MKKDERIETGITARPNLVAVNSIKSLRDWKKREREQNAIKINDDGVGIENGPQKNW